jgi:sugar phosphate isomerase/epimerase
VPGTYRVFSIAWHLSGCAYRIASKTLADGIFAPLLYSSPTSTILADEIELLAVGWLQRFSDRGGSMPTPWMSRLSVSELSTYRWSFEEDVFRYKEHGYQAVGVWRPKLSDCGEAKGRELLVDHQMKVSSLNWAGGFTGHDGRSFRDAIHDALDAVDIAAQIGADCLVVLAGSRYGHTRNHAKRILTKALIELSAASKAMGLQLAVEPMHAGCAHEFTFLTSIPDTLDVIASVGQSNCGVVFDCYHMAHDENAVDWLPSIVPFIRLVQLGDAKHAPMGEQNRCLLGHGVLPLEAIVRTIEQYGYTGYYEVELMGEDVEHFEYGEILSRSFETAHSYCS